MDLNHVMISGRFGADPEERGNPDTDIANFRICVNGRKKDGDDWVDVPNWITCAAFGWQAKNLIDRGKKGDEVVITGKLPQESWEADGEKKTKSSGGADNVKVVPKAQGASTGAALEQEFGAEEVKAETPPF